MNKYKKLLVENKEKIIRELAGRMMDIVFVNCERQAERVFNEVIMRTVYDGEDNVEVTYAFTFVMNDLFQIAVREEREVKDSDINIPLVDKAE